MSELPASIEGDASLILTGDLTRASEVAGLDRPSDADNDQVNAWVGRLTSAPSPDETKTARVFVPLPDALIPFNASPTDMDAQVGWSVVDVNSYVALAQPPNDFLVVSGDFGEDTLDEDLSEVEDGIVTDVVGADHEQNTGEPTAFSRSGPRPGSPRRMRESRRPRTPQPSVIGWTARNRSPTMTDTSTWQARLDEHEVYAAAAADTALAVGDLTKAWEASEQAMRHAMKAGDWNATVLCVSGMLLARTYGERAGR